MAQAVARAEALESSHAQRSDWQADGERGKAPRFVARWGRRGPQPQMTTATAVTAMFTRPIGINHDHEKRMSWS
jgi:hypothetical protein